MCASTQERVAPASAAPRIAGTVAAGLVVLVCHLASADESWVVSRVPLTTEICDTCPTAVSIPLTLAGVNPGSVRVQVLDVLFQNRHETSALHALHPHVDAAAVLEIVIDEGGLRSAGAYQVLLQFTAEKQPPAAWKMEILRPPAALQPFTTVVVDRVLAAPWGNAGAAASHVTLLETSRKTAVSALDVRPNDLTPGSGGDITFSGPRGCATAEKGWLPAGGRACLDYTVNGPFPLGPQTRSFTLAAPELQAPVALTFDVRTHLSRLWVPLFIALGILASFIIKVVLQRRLELLEARLAAADVLEVVQADLNRIPDRAFQQALTGKEAALTAASQAGDPQAIKKAAADLDQEWQAAVSALAAARQHVQQTIDALRGIAETPWQIPAAFMQPLGALQQSLAVIRGRLAANRVDEAAAGADRAQRDAVVGLSRATTTWQEDVQDYLAAIDLARGLSPDVKAAAGPALATGKAAVGVTRLAPTATPAQTLAALQGVSDEQRSVRTALRALAAAVEAEIDRGIQILDSTRAAVPELTSAASAARRALTDAIEGPADARDAAVASLAAIDTAWRAVLARELGGRAADGVATLLADERYLDAAAAAAAIVAPPALPAAAAAAAKPPRVALAAPIVPAEPRQPVFNFRTVSEAASPVRLLRGFRMRTRQEFLLTKAGQSLGVAVLAGLVGYGLFAPKFIGDYQDFTVIFFWAFGLDLTVEAVTRLAPAART